MCLCLIIMVVLWGSKPGVAQTSVGLTYDFVYSADQEQPRFAYVNGVSWQHNSYDPDLSIISSEPSPNSAYVVTRRGINYCVEDQTWHSIACISGQITGTWYTLPYWSLDNKHFWVASGKENLSYIWNIDASQGNLLASFSEKDVFGELAEQITLQDISVSAGLAIFQGHDYELYFVDLESQQHTRTYTDTLGGNITNMALGFSPDGRYLAVMTSRFQDRNQVSHLALIDLQTGEKTINELSFRGVRLVISGNKLFWSHDSQQIAFINGNPEDSHTYSSETLLFSVPTGQLSRIAQNRAQGVDELRWSPDDQALAQILCPWGMGGGCELSIVNLQGQNMLIIDATEGRTVWNFLWVPHGQWSLDAFPRSEMPAPTLETLQATVDNCLKQSEEERNSLTDKIAHEQWPAFMAEVRVLLGGRVPYDCGNTLMEIAEALQTGH